MQMINNDKIQTCQTSRCASYYISPSNILSVVYILLASRFTPPSASLFPPFSTSIEDPARILHSASPVPPANPEGTAKHAPRQADAYRSSPTSGPQIRQYSRSLLLLCTLPQYHRTAAVISVWTSVVRGKCEVPVAVVVVGGLARSSHEGRREGTRRLVGLWM